MRRIGVLGAVLVLAGCQAPSAYVGNPTAGMGTFLADTLGPNFNPNAPAAESENLQRVTGQHPQVAPLLPETGDVWPGPPPPEPTLADIERQQNEGLLNQPLSSQPPPETRGPHSSAPPPPIPAPPGASSQGAMSGMPAMPPQATTAPTGAPPPLPVGAAVQTPTGPAVISGGTGGVQTYHAANGGVGTVINNGNGTVTLVDPNGGVSTVPAPR